MGSVGKAESVGRVAVADAGGHLGQVDGGLDRLELAYNLIRRLMAQAATREGVPPRSISFKETLQVVEAFQPLIAYQVHRGASHGASLYQEVLRSTAVHRVADRPDRFEPRMAKRRPKRYNRLTEPRQGIKRQVLKRVANIQVPFVRHTDTRKEARDASVDPTNGTSKKESLYLI
jgi:hypothetical protein